MEPLSFVPSMPFTIGVELEFQLLDAASLDLAPVAPALLSRVPLDLRANLKAEFIQSMLEVSTPICRDLTQVEQELTILIRLLEKMAAALGCVPFAASLHPFAGLEERHLSPGVRYGEIMQELQLAGRRLITQALHVHIGLPDAETALKVCNSIRTHLPTLLALTTSSPYMEGEDTGFFSYRTNLFQALPRSGIPETLPDWPFFTELIALLNEATLLRGIKELWWDVRPHPDFGTVEVRICDLPSRFDEILGIVALIQALVASLAGKEAAPPPCQEILRNNKWHASRYGLAGNWIASCRGGHTTFARAAAFLLEEVRETAEALGGFRYFSALHRVLETGTSAHQQHYLFGKIGDFREVIESMRRDFWR